MRTAPPVRQDGMKTVLMLSIRGRVGRHLLVQSFPRTGAHLSARSQQNHREVRRWKSRIGNNLSREADEFASGILVPKDKWSKSIARESFHTKAIRMFSRDVGVDAGIVVGRLQHEGFVKPSLGKRPADPVSNVRWTETPKCFFSPPHQDTAF